MARARKKTFAALFRPLSAAGTRAASSGLPEDNPALQAMWNVVSRIPRGRATTYGAVARAAGFPGRARMAGRALRVAGEDAHLPWHRVVGAGGRIVFPPDSKEYKTQSRLLKAEGVAVQQGKVARAALTDLEDF